jgi:NAD(P)H-hydrate epimerase
MLKVSTAKEMQYIDRVTIEKYGITGTILMERAGLTVVSRINEILARVYRQLSSVVVLCGGGNNGGDGLVIARELHNQGKGVEVFLSAKPKDLKGDARLKYLIAKKIGVKIYPIKEFLTPNFRLQTQNSIIVDALLGTGLSKEIRPPLSRVIKKVNHLNCPVVSIDIPSGISSDTGQIMGHSIKADYTITFGLPKRGHMLYPGAEYTGRLYIEDIGFPKELLMSEKIKVNLVQENDAISLLPKRPKYSHKGTYGHVLIVAGSRGKTGAGFMAARTCLRAGAGLVTIGVPATLVNNYQSRVTEEMILPLPDKGNGTLSAEAIDAVLNFLGEKATVLAIGPGISTDKEIVELVGRLIVSAKVPVVIDADGLNALSEKISVLKKSKTPTILTPHPGEMSRLIKLKLEGKGQESEKQLLKKIERDRINTALSFAKQMKTYIVLKGVPTVTATPDGTAFINTTGNPGMASAGTGDVLTGMISSFLAQRLSPQDASILGVYMHGLVGDIVAEKKGQRSLVASDIIHALPDVFRMLEKEG